MVECHGFRATCFFQQRLLIIDTRPLIKKFDALFSNNGFRVLYLERHFIREQIELFESSRRVIGYWSAGFHGLALSRKAKEIESTVMCEELINTNYLMFDALCGNVVRYIGCLRPSPEFTQEWPYTVSVVQPELLAPLLKTDFGTDWVW